MWGESTDDRWIPFTIGPVMGKAFPCHDVFRVVHDDVIEWKHLPCYWPLCVGKPQVTGEFPSQRPVTRSFDVFFVLCLNKQLSKQSRYRWFWTPLRSLWRRCNVSLILVFCSLNDAEGVPGEATETWEQLRLLAGTTQLRRGPDHLRQWLRAGRCGPRVL